MKMMKYLIVTLIVCLSFVTANSQTVTGDRIVARSAFYLKDRWIDSIQNTINFSGKTRAVPTSDAVSRYLQDSAWVPSGNIALNPYIHFLGTRDNFGISIRTNNKYAGRFDSLQRFQAEWITGINDTASEFEIILIPDTQNEVDSAISLGHTSGRSIFQWIKDNAVTQNIKAVIGLGDITNASTTIQNDTADKWYDLLDDAGIPYVPTIGNHDYNGNLPATRNATNYLATFGPARLTGKPWYGGSYWKAPENFWVNFNVMGRPFTVLSLEYWPRDSTLLWADSLVSANPTRNFIYTTHAYLTAFGERSADTSLYGNNVTGQGADNAGQEQWDKFVKKHKNIQFVFNGHFAGHDANHKSGYTRNFDDVGTNGNLVHQLFVNYQTDTAGGNGWFTRMRFKPKENKIEVTYYSAHLGRYDTRVSSFTYYFPPLQVQSDLAVQGNLVVDKFSLFNQGVGFPFMKKFQLPYVYENGAIRGTDSALYNHITGEFRINTPTDLGNYKTQFTGDMINKTGTITVDGGNVVTKSSTGVQTGQIGEGYAGTVAAWQIGSSGTTGNNNSLTYVSSSGTHGNIGTALYDAEKALVIGSSTAVPMLSFYQDARYMFLHGSDVSNAHYYRPTDAMLTVAGKDSTSGLAFRVSSLAQNAPGGSLFPHQFSVGNNGVSTFWNTDQYVTTQGKTQVIFRNGFRQSGTNLIEIRNWNDSLNAYFDTSGWLITKGRVYISPTITVPSLTANLHLVHPTGSAGLMITRAQNDNGGANLTYFKTRTTDPTVNVAAQAGDYLHNNYFYAVTSTPSRVLSHERNSFVKTVGASYVSAYWRWAGYNESGSYINQMYLMPDGAISIGVNPSFPDTSAILDLQSTIKAFYPPRMNTTQMNAIPGVDAGAIIFNTDSSAHCYYDGAAWRQFGSGGSVSSLPLSSLTAATASNDINHADYNQIWRWNSLAGGRGLNIGSNGTTTTNGGGLLKVSRSGTHAASGVTSYALEVENSHDGTSSTNVAGHFSAISGTNNYAIIVPSGGGSVGIGTSTPNYALEVSTSSANIFAASIRNTNTSANTAGLGISVHHSNVGEIITAYGGAAGATERFSVKGNGEIRFNNDPGTSGQVLTSAGANAPPTWQTPSTGMTNPMTTAGDLILGGASGTPTRLGIGTNGYVLTSNGTTASWQAAAGGGITVGTTTITSGTSGRIAYNNAGVYGEKAVTGTGDVVLATSPTITSPVLGTSYSLNDGTTKLSMATNFYGVDIASKYVRFGSSGNNYFIISTNDAVSTDPAATIQTIVTGKPGLKILLTGSQTADAFYVENSGGNKLVDITANGVLDLYNYGTAPTASVTNGIRLYAEDVSSSAELKVRDEAGNITTLSPHNFKYIPGGPSEKLAWSFYSEKDGRYITADMALALRTIEQLTERVAELEKKLNGKAGSTTKLIHKGKTKRN